MTVYGAEAVCLATVFEDCVDELAILGYIMPSSYENIDDSEEILNDELKAVSDHQENLETQFEDAVKNRNEMKGDLPSAMNEAHNEIQSVAKDLKSGTHAFSRGMKNSPLTQDNLSKVQEDRQFLQNIMRLTYQELLNDGTFTNLSNAVTNELNKKQELHEIVNREEKSRQRIKELKKEIEDVKKKEEKEIKSRNEMIAHLKDQLQEMKAKTNMEQKYIKKKADVMVAQTLKKCTLSEKEIRNEMDRMRQEIDQEERVNSETESWLRSYQQELEHKVDFWTDKSEKDVEELQHKLDVLKASKAKDLQKLTELSKTYKEYEEIVLQDRIEKEKLRRKAEQEAIQLESSLKIQSWWRTVMVIKSLGPYGKKKKKKGKGKGKGKGKKGKKK